MSKLQFGDYIFPYNPRVIDLSQELDNQPYTLPYIGTGFQLMGAKPRLISLEGEFFADSAAEAAQLCTELETVFDSRRRGMLFLPFKKPFYALFTELKTKLSGDGRIIYYRAQFIEDTVVSDRGRENGL